MGHRGPNISDGTRIRIGELYISMRREDRGCRAEDVRAALEKELKDRATRARGDPGKVKAPGLSAVQKELTKLRNPGQADAASGDEGLEAPWSLAKSLAYGISPEATPALLRIRRWCIVMGTVFTIREARWAAHLRGTVPAAELASVAYRYATRERACELLKTRGTYTDDLDAELALSGLSLKADPRQRWVYSTALRTGAVAQPLDSNSVTELAEAIRDAPESEDQLIARYLTRKQELHALLRERPPGEAVEYYLGLTAHDDSKLDQSADEVYALWLRKLRKGPQWRHMSLEAKNKIARRLRDEVTNAYQSWQEQRTSGTVHWWDAIMGPRWEPSERLLGMVGIDEGTKRWGWQQNAASKSKRKGGKG